MEKVEFDGVSASIIRGGRDYIYTVDLSKRIAETYELCVSKPTLIILETDWESNLTPWQAKKVFKRGKDFGGNAKEYLSKVCRFISKTEEGNVVRRRMIAGYSLSGLFAVWTAYNTDMFSAVASISGSLWYAGFVEYASNHSFLANRAYFSVGDRESKTANPIMSDVELRTKEICDKLASCGIKTKFELTEGGHFDNVTARIAKAIDFLTEEI